MPSRSARLSRASAMRISIDMTKNLPDRPDAERACCFPGMSLPITAARPADAARDRGRAARPRAPRVRRRPARRRRRGHPREALHGRHRSRRSSSVQRGLGGVRVVLEGHERGIAVRVAPTTTATSSRRSSPAVELPPLDAEGPDVRRAAPRGPRARRRARRASAACPRRPSSRCSRRSPSRAGSPTSSPATSTCRSPSARRCSRRSRSRTGCAACWSTSSARSRCCRRRKTSSRRSRRSSASASARSTCASSCSAIQKELGEGDEAQRRGARGAQGEARRSCRCPTRRARKSTASGRA